jgi:hypothetical protein
LYSESEVLVGKDVDTDEGVPVDLEVVDSDEEVADDLESEEEEVALDEIVVFGLYERNKEGDEVLPCS